MAALDVPVRLVFEGVQLEAGDRVLILFRGEPDPKLVRENLDQLEQWFPGVTFHAVCGAEQLAVQRDDEHRPGCCRDHSGHEEAGCCNG